MKGWVDGQKEERVDGWTGWVDRMDGWMDGREEERMGEWI